MKLYFTTNVDQIKKYVGYPCCPGGTECHCRNHYHLLIPEYNVIVEPCMIHEQAVAYYSLKKFKSIVCQFLL